MVCDASRSLRIAAKWSISSHFPTLFQTYGYEVVGQGVDVTQTLVKVTNTKLDISTFWPRHKFEARLVQMRELFQVRIGTFLFCPEEDKFTDYCIGKYLCSI